MTATDNLLTVEDCLRAVRELRFEVAELRQQLATEVRTRRLVVVDQRGRDVIVAQSYLFATQLEVRYLPEDSRNDDDAMTATLFAGDESDPPEAFISVASSSDEVQYVASATHST